MRLRQFVQDDAYIFCQEAELRNDFQKAKTNWSESKIKCERLHDCQKIRELSARKIPLIAVVGEKEAINQSLNLRRLGILGQQEI